MGDEEASRASNNNQPQRSLPQQNGGGTIQEEKEECESSCSQDLNGIDAELEDHKAEEERAADDEGEVDADENCVTDSQHKNNNLIIHAS